MRDGGERGGNGSTPFAQSQVFDNPWNGTHDFSSAGAVFYQLGHSPPGRTTAQGQETYFGPAGKMPFLSTIELSSKFRVYRVWTHGVTAPKRFVAWSSMNGRQWAQHALSRLWRWGGLLDAPLEVD